MPGKIFLEGGRSLEFVRCFSSAEPNTPDIFELPNGGFSYMDGKIVHNEGHFEILPPEDKARALAWWKSQDIGEQDFSQEEEDKHKTLEAPEKLPPEKPIFPKDTLESADWGYLKDIGAIWDVTSNSKEKLIEKILAAQKEYQEVQEYEVKKPQGSTEFEEELANAVQQREKEKRE